MFIQTEATPDPARLRFLPGREVLADGILNLRNKEEAKASPLAERLFAIAGIASVSFGKESITVTKADGDWRHLKPAILGAIMDHFVSGEPVLRKKMMITEPSSGQSSFRLTGEALSCIREALAHVIDPELGYNIVDLGFIYDIDLNASGAVHVIMTTTTPGCPATDYLKQGAGEAVVAVPGIEFVEVSLTHEPRWTPDMMSPEAKAHFRISDGG